MRTMDTHSRRERDVVGNGTGAGKPNCVSSLTYCTNIHPGESWREIFRAIREHAPAVKAKVSPDRPFPIGLRLSGGAVREMGPADAADFRSWCREGGFYVATINGFPYGTFHHRPIKQGVYLPDWRFAERLDYTRKLADLLALWLPEAMTGSISSVPVGFRSAIAPEDFPRVRRHLLLALEHLERLARRTGRKIVLALEPEPGCVAETTQDVVDLFARLDLPASLRPFLAVCYDCCHQALQFEDPAASLQLLADHDIAIGHVQVSSALRLTDSRIGLLGRFREPCYLHQTVGRKKSGTLLRYEDLDLAIAAAPEEVEEWRVHFHVPVFLERAGECATTRSFLEKILPLLAENGAKLEVETYTWSILPPELQCGTVTECLVREIEWVAANLVSCQVSDVAKSLSNFGLLRGTTEGA